MSVLIKNMEMPLRCSNCPLCADEGRFCMAARRCIPMVGRVDWCPLVDVPTPHGRLIDRDKLTGEQYKDGHIMVVEMDAIEDAPTVIEAEE